MLHQMKRITKFRGATAIGYGLAVGLIGVTSILAITVTGEEITCLFDKTASAVGNSPGQIIGCGGAVVGFDFTDLSGQEPSTLLTSNAITLDMSGPSTLTVTNATLLRGGTPVGSSADFNPGDSLSLRLTSSAEWDTGITAIVSIGREQVDWRVSTRAQDTSVTLSSGFDDITGAEPSTPQTSNTITVSDFDPGGVTIEAPSGVIIVINGVPEGSGPIELNPGDQIALQTDSAVTFEETTTIPVTVGDQTVEWDITTRGNDLSPAASGSLGSDLDIQPSSSQISDIITLSDFDGSLPISATNGATVEVNSGSGFAPASTAMAGDQIRLVKAANSGNNSTSTASFSIGDYTSPNYTIRTWYYTTGSATGYGSCSGPCSSTGTRSPTGWTCNRSDGTTGHSSGNCSSPGNQSCSTDSCFTSTTPTVSGEGGTDPTVTFGTQTLRITCSADGGVKNALDDVDISASSSSASALIDLRTPLSGPDRFATARINFSTSGGNIVATSMTTGFNGKQHMCFDPGQSNCAPVNDINCSSPIACRVWNLSTGSRWYFVRTGGNRGQSYVYQYDNIIQTTCRPNNWPSSIFAYCWQNGTC
ncbi:MAG: hypothetical protein Alpg2KO_31100 [Alphaproteobacteria bacterium]